MLVTDINSEKVDMLFIQILLRLTFIPILLMTIKSIFCKKDVIVNATNRILVMLLRNEVKLQVPFVSVSLSYHQ